MEKWTWLLYLLTNWYTWPVLGAILYAIASPFIRMFRLWQAKNRFIRSQGAKLENPQNADARFQLANIYAEGRGFRQALEYAQAAVKVAEENPLYEGQVPYHMMRLLGDMYYRRRRYEESIAAYRRALSVKSDLGYGDARFGLGRALYRKGELESAFDILNRAIEDNASNLEGYYWLAVTSRDLGRLRETDQVKREFWRVAAQLPAFAGKHRMRWRLAFLLFPFTRGVL
jgi:tetratricopeptide (TPR) repeat protein